MSSVNPASAHELPRRTASTIELPRGGGGSSRFRENDRVVNHADVSPGIRPPFATATIRDVIHSDLPSLSARASLIKRLLYRRSKVNRRLSIPSGLFSPPTEESTFDPRTQPTSSLPPSYSRTPSERTTHGALRRPKSNLIDPKGEYVRFLRYRRPFSTGRVSSACVVFTIAQRDSLISIDAAQACVINANESLTNVVDDVSSSRVSGSSRFPRVFLACVLRNPAEIDEPRRSPQSRSPQILRAR